MDAPSNMTNMATMQMLMLLLLMSICTFWVGRMIQWILLRKKLPRRKILFILLISLLISYLLALVLWFYWPRMDEPMWNIFFLPAVVAELLILISTIIIFKRQKHT